LRVSCAAGDAVDGLMIDCSAQSKIKIAFGYAIQGLMLAAARTLRVALGHRSRSARFAGFFQAR
jgi:hypothetical protein